MISEVPKPNTDFASFSSGISSTVTTVPLSVLLDLPAVRRYRLHICNVWCAVVGLSVLLVAFVSRFAGYAALVISYSGVAGPVRTYIQLVLIRITQRFQ